MSTQLIPVVSAVIGTETVQTVDGRVLHTFLEVQTEFKNWIVRRIDEYGFEEGKDFRSFLTESTGGRPTKDYTLTLDMAKELSMVERNAKGKQARPQSQTGASSMSSNALVSLKDGKPVTTSQLVAESFGKRHANVLRDIERIIESPVYLERNQLNFEFVNYLDAKGERRPMYEMDRQGFEILAMGFTGEEALRWKFKYSDAFAAMEAALKNPSPQPTPAPVRKPIRSRDDLSFTQRDSQGQLQNWVVAYDRNSSWHINVAIGKAYFEEVLELGQHDPAEAQDAVQYALVNGAATNFRPGGWGIECGFAMALAEALFASPSAPKTPKRGITHQKIQPKQLVYQEDACQKVLAAIQGEKQHGMTARGLQQACWTYRSLSKDKRDELLNTLIEDEKIVAMVPKGKRALTYVARSFVRTQEIGG